MTTETFEKKETKSKLILPKGPMAPTRTAPRTAIWFGLPKCGKTTELSKLPNHLNIDAEKGSDMVTATRIQPPLDAGPVAVFNWVKEVAATIKEEGRPYDHVIIETLSYLDELSEWVGTFNYMNSPQGKKFNRVEGIEGGPLLKPTSKDYESVHDIGQGYGYRWSREAMVDIFDTTKDLGRICTHYVCHISDKYIASKNDAATQIRVMELSLTGKLKNIIPRDVDAIGYLYQKNGVINVSFKGSEEKSGGIRGEGSPLQGYEGPLDWNMIFPPEK
jgi:AAA domain-containing protein